MKTFTKFLCASVLAFSATAFADVSSAKPIRVGPVQNYGALGTSGSKIISLKNNKQVVLRGVSLFWSDATGSQYYNPEVISWAAKNLGIDVFRFAMGIEYYKADESDPLDENYSYKGNPSSNLALLEQMVEAAIKNDIYIIIDWHSHRATNEQDLASAFFTQIAQKYASVPNVIFEIFNEPVNQSWSEISNYANTIVPKIRQYTQNLILVGTPSWSQLSSYGGVSGTNIAYVLHFYAGTHSVSTYGTRATAAMNSGNAVFISEWGTTSADGKGTANESATNEWLTFMDQNNISNCNWSLRQYRSTVDNSEEGSAIFDGSENLTTQEALNNASYTASGTIVKNYLQKHIRPWADSLVAGKSGSCHFKSKTVSETAGSVDLTAGCSYTSSNTEAVSVSGSTASIVGAGFAILTGNDGSESVIVVEEEPKQTSKITDFTCRYGGNCSQGHEMRNYTGSSDFETLLAKKSTTVEGGKMSFQSLSPDLFSVKMGICNNKNYCYGATYGVSLPMLQFTGSYGEGKIVVSAPAVTGYRALNDTITVIFAKGQQRLHSKFKNRTLTLGELSEANALPDTTLNGGTATSYTYNDQESTPYLTKLATQIQAGTSNAIVRITASAPETENWEAFQKSITVIIGDSALASAENKEEYYATPIIASAKIAPFRTEIQHGSLLLQIPQSGWVNWAIYTSAGKVISKQKQNLSAGTHLISLQNIPTGSYILRVRQGSKQASFHWNKH